MGGIEYDKLWIPAATAILVAVVNYVQKGMGDKLTRRTDRLKEQLQNLYGPLAFLAEHNFRLSTTYLSTRPHAATIEDSVKDEARSAIISNNKAMLDILRQNYAQLDRRDMLIVHSFASACQMRPSDEAFLRPSKDHPSDTTQGEFGLLVTTRFVELTSELSALTHSWWERRRRRGYARVHPR
jgi:hypothetical protein